MTFHIIIAGLWPIGNDAVISAMAQRSNCRVWCVWDDAPMEEYVDGVDLKQWFRKGRHYKAKNHYELIERVIKEAGNDDVLVFLDGDDKLMGQSALAAIAAAYERQKSLLLTYGSYRYKSSFHKGAFNGAYRSKRTFRRSQWHATHLKTVKVRLWKHLPVSCMKDTEGNWLKAATDVAMMLPLLEMAGTDRIRYIPQIIYEYNDENPRNVHKEMSKLQIETDKWIRAQPSFKRLDEV